MGGWCLVAVSSWRQLMVRVWWSLGASLLVFASTWDVGASGQSKRHWFLGSPTPPREHCIVRAWQTLAPIRDHGFCGPDWPKYCIALGDLGRGAQRLPRPNRSCSSI